MTDKTHQFDAVAAVKDRIHNASQILNNQNSGAYIHEVANMRQIVECLLSIPDEDLVTSELVLTVNRLENKLIEFLKRRYC